MKNVVLLGATGSVGTNTLDVIRSHLGDFRVTGLAARTGSGRLADLAAEFPAAAIAVAGDDATAFEGRLESVGWKGEYYAGPHAVAELVREVDADVCVAGIGGVAGLEPTFAAAERGLRILLANKEVLVSAGRLFMDAARAGGATILPLDSEHSALWQCLHGRDMEEIDRLIITASGGPFRTWSAERMRDATPEDAVKHPVWRMGQKISVDSATMANKVLEVIEAQHLFGLAVDRIGILVHPQSVVHGMIEFIDGSVLAHLGVADMRQPIAHMLLHPHRQPNALPRLDLARIGSLTFEEPDRERFPLIDIGLNAARRGGCYPALFNAANETAVELFLSGRLRFGDIATAVAKALELDGSRECARLDEVFSAHEAAREAVVALAEGR